MLAGGGQLNSEVWRPLDVYSRPPRWRILVQDSILGDFRLALRHIARTPTVALAVVVTLSLAMGFNTALFSVFYAIVLRPLPVDHPDSLVVLQAVDAKAQQSRPIYYSAYEQLAHLPVFEALELYSGGGSYQIEWRGTRSEGTIEASTPGLFEVLGLRPHLGRFFTDQDAPTDGETAAVVVLSYDLWRRAFGGDAAILGDSVLIGGVPATVIGIAPPRYKGFYVDGGFGFSVPVSFLSRQMNSGPPRPVRGLNVVGRLASGVSLEQARSAMEVGWNTIRASAVPVGVTASEQQELATHLLHMSSLENGFSTLRETYGAALKTSWLGTALLLVIGCLNLGGLFLSQAAARESQFAVQVALGAPRTRIARQLLVETAVLTAFGTLLALPFAWWCTRAAEILLWQGISPLSQRLVPDGRVLLVTSAVGLGSGLLIGAIPAWRFSRNNLAVTLRPERSVVRGVGLWGRTFLVGQVALSLALLVGAGLLSATLRNLRSLDAGIQREGVRWSRLFAVPNGYRGQDDAAYYSELIRRLSQVPRVRSVALASYFPSYFGLEHLLPTQRLSRPAGPTPQDTLDVVVENVTPAFFETAGIAMIQGRDFTWADDARHPPVAIINEAARRALFSGDEPIGRTIQLGAEKGTTAEIIGIVSDAAIGSYRKPDAPVLFRPRMQELARSRAPVLLYRSDDDPSGVEAQIASVIAELGHEYPRRFSSLNEQIEVSLLRERLLARLASLFAGLAFTMAAVGTFALLAYSVSRRTREIGLRMALGAQRRAIISAIVRESAATAAIGVVIGVPISMAAATLVRSWLFGVSAWDARTFIASSAAFLVGGVVFGLAPALRASSIDPLIALREE